MSLKAAFFSYHKKMMGENHVIKWLQAIGWTLTDLFQSTITRGHFE